jgi:predicted PurR-regulated permease PerM
MELQIDSVTIICSIVILLSPVLLKKERFKLNKSDIASIATSLGIFGTFLGVFLGLVHFDVTNIQDSIPDLLNGLKTAFLTSIAGMITALIVKISPKIYGFKTADGTSPVDTDAEKMIDLLGKIEKAIGGDNDSSLVTQIIKLRDKTDTLNISFREFADKMVADSTQSLIDALTQVMKDFNTQINEQFGENFKHLNEGVEKLVVWQQQYKAYVETMTDRFEVSLESIEQCEHHLQSITDKAEAFAKTATKLEQLLSNLDTTFVGIDNMAKSMPNVFPQIQNTIKNLTDNFANDVHLAVRQNNTMIDTQKKAIDAQINTMATFYPRIEDHQKKLVQKLTADVDTLMKNQSDTIARYMATIDKQLEDILTQTLQKFGDDLVSISNKFTSDYSTLADALSRLRQPVRTNLFN